MVALLVKWRHWHGRQGLPEHRVNEDATTPEASTIDPIISGQSVVLPTRDSEGRFLPGNRASVGNGGGAKDLARWRRVALESTTDQDMLEIWGSLVTEAKKGEPWAVHEFLDRTMGKAHAAPAEAQQDTSALMARLWAEWASPRPEDSGSGQAEPVEDVAFEVKDDASEAEAHTP